jgi:hypothetical protein
MLVTKSKDNTCYLTKGGYLVTLDDRLVAPINLSPGLNHNNKNSKEYERGWKWKGNGTPEKGLQPDWTDKLTIIEELPFGIPEVLEGYQFIGGYPQFRKPENNEHYMGMKACGKPTQNVHVKGRATPDTSPSYYGGRRIIVEPIGSPIGSPVDPPTNPLIDDLVDITESHPDLIPRVGIDYFKTRSDNKVRFTSETHIKETIGYWVTKHGTRHYCLPKDVPNKVYTKMTDGVPLPKGIKSFDLPVNIGPVNFDLASLSNLTQINDLLNKKDEPTSLLTTFVGNPYRNSVWAAQKAFPYIVFYSVIVVAAYCMWDPSSVISLVKSCLPSISVELPTIIKD